jgi:hypothetical protein
LGEIANVGYALTGALTKTASGFAMQIQIADTVNGLTKASYTGSCSAQELENFTGIRKASLDLLTQMGVELTARSKEELIGSGAQQSINVETALAKGITAQRSGTVVEALNYYYNAASYDSGVPEVNSRLSTLQTSVKSGNFREDALNEIQQRNAWLALLKECEDFYQDKFLAEIVYDPAIYPVSEINFKKNTQNFVASVELRPTRDAQSMIKIFQNLRSGLRAIGGNDKLRAWSSDSYNFLYWPFSYGSSFKTEIGVKADLVNEKGKVLATSIVKLGYSFTDSNPHGISQPLEMLFRGDYSLFNSTWRSGNWYDVKAIASFEFDNVTINDITDHLTVKITHVAIDKDGKASWSNWPKTISDLNRDGWKVIDSETAGKTGLIQISAGTVRNSNSFTPKQNGWYIRTITAETDTEKIN